MISVLMSIYSEPKNWIELSINSISNQSYKNFEFIIINDNPKRQINIELLEKYKNIDPRIVVITNKSNLGLTKSLNKGLKIATGDYIARMDADDISLPDRFLKQVNFLDSNKEYIACGSSYTNINQIGGKKQIINSPETDAEIRSRIVLNNPIAHPTLMFRKDLVRLNNLYYDESLKYAQDYKFIFDLSQIGKLYNLQELLLNYRISEYQISKNHSKDQIKFANTIREIIVIKTLKKININTKVTTEIYDTNTSRFFEELNLLKIKNQDVILNNIKLSLLIYSNRKFKLKHYLTMLISRKNTFKTRLRILKYFNNVC